MERPVFKTKKEKLEWYLDEIDCYKEDMGKWYTMFVRRILPFLLFVIPLNILSNRLYCFVADKFLSGIFDSAETTPVLIIWPIVLLAFLIILIFLPRFATFCEFVAGGAYIYFAFADNLMETGLGYFTIIALSLFILMKLVFLVIEIIYLIVFRNDKPRKTYGDDTDLVF